MFLYKGYYQGSVEKLRKGSYRKYGGVIVGLCCIMGVEQVE